MNEQETDIIYIYEETLNSFSIFKESRINNILKKSKISEWGKNARFQVIDKVKEYNAKSKHDIQSRK